MYGIVDVVVIKFAFKEIRVFGMLQIDHYTFWYWI